MITKKKKKEKKGPFETITYGFVTKLVTQKSYLQIFSSLK